MRNIIVKKFCKWLQLKYVAPIAERRYTHEFNI